MNEKKLKMAQDLCVITETENTTYTLKVPLTKITHHKTLEDAIATRDKTLAKLLWTPPY